MRMVLVGGDLHTEMVKQAGTLKDFKSRQSLGMTPTESSLEFGHVYRKRDQTMHVFLGRVKVPNNERPLFAFAALPTAPSDYATFPELDDLARHEGSHYDHMREERAVAQKWATMTWLERCQWDWYDKSEYLCRQYEDQVPPGYYHHPVDIVLMSSPKMEAEVTEDCAELARQLRENRDAKHKYVNGHGDDLAEVRFMTLHNGGMERDWHVPRNNNWYRLSQMEQQRRERDFKKNVQEECTEARREYQSELRWAS